MNSRVLIEQIEVGLLQNFSYLLGCKETGECALIDPGWEPDRLLKAVERNGMRLTAILLTHTHFDHIEGLEGIFRMAGPKKIFVHEAEQANLEPFKDQVIPIRDGTEIPLGDLSVRCRHTPGHLPGCVCYQVEKSLFTGDTLFVNSAGRTDFPESSPRDFQRSIRLLKGMDEDITIYPGHDYGPTPTSTIGEQKRNNPFLMVNSFV